MIEAISAAIALIHPEQALGIFIGLCGCRVARWMMRRKSR